MSLRKFALIGLTAGLFAGPASAYTRNIMITGYWSPTNEMVRRFSANPDQNPDGWIGENWEGRGYNVYSFFPEFSGTNDFKGHGDFEVDYQDTSSDWWRITEQVKPVAIITFSRGDLRRRDWEIEYKQRNLTQWIDDYQEPFQPTPAPPDGGAPADFVRLSSLPMQDIADAVNAAGLGVNAHIDETGFGGGFLSEFMAYHGTWYHDLHTDPSDPAWNIAAGHIHVGGRVTTEQGFEATKVSLRELIRYVDTQIPEPASGLLVLVLAAAVRGRR